LGQGRLTEAAGLMSSLVDIKRTAYGSDHPDTLDSIDKLVSIYRDDGKLIEAGDVAIETLSSRVRNSKPTNAQVLQSIIQKLVGQGNTDDAESLRTKLEE
ncbi:hypothetical protein FPQ18DRAFT_236581, partial [Pyronema domesticum]